MNCHGPRMNMDPALHTERKPDWIKVRLPNDPKFWSTKALVSDLNLVTVCEEAQCPNRWECWSHGTATFMIAGEKCTRACGFCAVKTARPDALEADEPERVAEACKRMELKHVVITAVARDDLRDGGAEHFKHVIEAVRSHNPGIIIEALSVSMPVIATKWMALPEIITTEHNGILIEIKNTNQLKNAITSFNTENYGEYSNNALDSFKNFDSAIVFNKIIERYLL